MVIDGPYIEELGDMERDWVGSTNQKVIFLSDKYSSGVEFDKQEHSMEVMISDKNILINGWPFI